MTRNIATGFIAALAACACSDTSTGTTSAGNDGGGLSGGGGLGAGGMISVGGSATGGAGTPGTGGSPAAGGAVTSGTGGTLASGGAVTTGTGGTQASGGAPHVGCPPALHGPSLVGVPAPAGAAASGYCIDATEVTNGDYAAFLAAGYPRNGQDPWCSWNTTFTPSGGWPATGQDNHPVAYVDWCDAFAFCKWAGKHLCGKIGGGSSAYSDLMTATSSEWYNACSAGGIKAYPYGNTFEPTSCNDSDIGLGATVPVGSKAACEGGYPGIHDLSGNVLEWEDSCDGTTGDNDRCRIRGGAFSASVTDLVCGNPSAVGYLRNGAFVDFGFRCCAPSS